MLGDLGLRVVPNSSVDSFSSPNGVRHFFVSHAHTDHLRGLEEFEPHPHQRIYCSEQTRSLLLHLFPRFLRERHFKALPVGHEVAVADDLTVTAMEARHCVGSVMFLFRCKGERILWTGDFRYQEGMEVPRNVDVAYVDTTFADMSEWPKFPSTQQVVDGLTRLVRERSQDCHVFLEAELLGHEGVCMALATSFGSKLCVRRPIYQQLVAATPQLRAVLTTIKQRARFFVVPAGTLVELEREEVVGNEKQLFIKASTQYFGKRAGNVPFSSLAYSDGAIWTDRARGTSHILLSLHSSATELREFLRKLAPGRLVPITEIERDTLQELRALCRPKSKRRKRAGNKENL